MGSKPTASQVAALFRFARSYGHGRHWKSALLACWERSSYFASVTADDQALLQGVRNSFGPSWLAKFKLPTVAPVEGEPTGAIAKLVRWVAENPGKTAAEIKAAGRSGSIKSAEDMGLLVFRDGVWYATKDSERQEVR